MNAQDGSTEDAILPQDWDIISPVTASDWSELQLEYGPDPLPGSPKEENVFASILRYARDDLDCRTIIVEKKYYDEDFIDIFSSYISRTYQSSRTHLCVRIHFFSVELTPTSEMNKTEILSFLRGCENKSYLGYVVCRPTDENVCGKTNLRTPKRKEAGLHYYFCTTTVNANVAGTNFSLHTATFLEGDGTINLCAHSCILMHLRALAGNYPVRKLLPSEIRRLAAKSHIGGSSTPTLGMNPWQIEESLTGLGLAATVYYKRKKGGLSLKSVKPGQLLSPYLASKIPSMVLFEDDEDWHSVLVVGGESEVLSDPPSGSVYFLGSDMSTFYCHDDNEGPFREIGASELEKAEMIILGLPDNIRLLAEHVQQYVRGAVKDHSVLFNKSSREKGEAADVNKRIMQFFKQRSPLVVNLSLCRSNELKSSLSNRETKLHPDIEADYRLASLPKYLWLAELTDYEYYCKGEILGEMLFDATSDRSRMPLLSIHIPNLFLNTFVGIGDRTFDGDVSYSPYGRIL